MRILALKLEDNMTLCTNVMQTAGVYSDLELISFLTEIYPINDKNVP